jgi:hypothetical protein
MLIVYYWIEEKRIDRRNVVAFAFFFAASLINAAAPGNFVRKDAEGGAELSLVTGIQNTWIFFKGEVDTLLRGFNFAAILVVFVICGILIRRKGKKSVLAWYVTGVLTLLTPFICAFPVVLGYGVPWVPNRCMYIFYVSLVMAFGNMGIILGHMIGGLFGDKKNYVAIPLVVLALVFVVISPFDPRSYRSVRILKGLYDHVYQENLEDTKELFTYFEEHKGEDVEVDVALTPDDVEYAYVFFLTDDTRDRINKSVKWYFELESVKNTRVKRN